VLPRGQDGSSTSDTARQCLYAHRETDNCVASRYVSRLEYWFPRSQCKYVGEVSGSSHDSFGVFNDNFRELSGLNVCMRVWESVPSDQISSAHGLTSGLEAFTQHMARSALEVHDDGVVSISSTPAGNSSFSHNSEIFAHVHSLFSPEEGSEPSTSGAQATSSEHTSRRRFSVSTTTTSGTYFDSTNPVHRLAKETFARFEEDVSSVGTYHSHIV